MPQDSNAPDVHVDSQYNTGDRKALSEGPWLVMADADVSKGATGTFSILDDDTEADTLIDLVGVKVVVGDVTEGTKGYVFKLKKKLHLVQSECTGE